MKIRSETMYKRSGTVAEYEKHAGTIIMFPFRNDIWRDDAKFMQEYIINLANIISEFEHVYFICREQDIPALSAANLKNTSIISMPYDDIWARDIAPSFFYEDGQLKCVDWKFNAWGGKKGGSYYPWDKDDSFASNFAKYLSLPVKRIELVLEGGAIISDGKGTLFSTRSVAFSKYRNPFCSKAAVENQILSATHDSRIIWLDHGLANDETDGHIDNILSVVSPTELCMAWTDDRNNVNYKRVHRAFELLNDIESTEGTPYKINLIPLPPELKMLSHEANGLVSNKNALERTTDFILPASYLNYYLVNGAVLIPAFGCELDEPVKAQFQKIFPDRKIIQIYSREPLLGGGGLHCILHEVPVGV